MKKLLFAAAIACLALFTSCEKAGVNHTGDQTGTLYGVWVMDSKTEISKNSSGEEIKNETDYGSFHFYLALGEFPFPHAIAKKGSFTEFDLDDVDVDAVRFTYNADKKQISFLKTLWLSEGLLYHMRLSGTYDVLELTDTKFVIQQEVLGVKTIFTYHKQK
ncbi:MAG: hypothetical protein J6O01_00235 [Bacteroidales bacterium]|nr:hypothetical protein [Bacteroidales bacterium]